MTRIIVASSILIAAILILRHVLRRDLSRRVQYALWALVLVRLLVPFSLPVKMNLSLPRDTQPSATQRTTVETVLPQTVIEPEKVIPAQAETPSAADTMVNSAPEVIVQSGKAAEILGVLWAAGAALVAAYFLFINARFSLFLRKHREPWPAEGQRHKVWLVREGLPSPCAFGRSIYITPDAVQSDEMLRHVLAHEETHFRHGDPFWALLRCACLAVYWINPLVWAAAKYSKIDCELACDEGTLKRLGAEERLSYGETLLQLIPRCHASVQPFLAATTMTDGKRQIRERITRIAEGRKPALAAALAAVMLTGALTFGTFVRAEAGNGGFRSLTAAEIDAVNGAFEQILSVETEEGTKYFSNPVNGFFAAYYADVRDLPLADFIAYMSPEKGDSAVSEEEFQALRQLEGFPFAAERLGDMFVPVTRHRRAAVDAMLRKYAGITSADLSNRENTFYLCEYDAWYTFTSDYAAGYFTCVGGKVYKDAAVLNGNPREDGSYDQLTLIRTAEGWKIKAFKIAADGRNLTQAEIDRVNKAFEQVISVRTLTGEVLYANPVNGFFASEYTDVRDLNFDEFLAYFPPKVGDKAVDEKEFQALRCHPDFRFRAETLGDMIVPVNRHRRAYVDEVLMRYAGITSADLNHESSLLYLSEYDAWYNYTSDFGAGYFNCVGGTVHADTFAVLKGNVYEDGSFARLLLVKEEGAWHIKSFVRVKA